MGCTTSANLMPQNDENHQQRPTQEIIKNNDNNGSVIINDEGHIRNSSLMSSLSSLSFQSSTLNNKESDVVKGTPSSDFVHSKQIQSISSMQEDKVKMAEEEIDIDLNDPELGKAAIKIQTGFKNFMAKKKTSMPNDTNKDTLNPVNKDSPMKIGEDNQQEIEKSRTLDEALGDIDLTDPEMEKAATKIQASFRGYKNRKETTMKST